MALMHAITHGTGFGGRLRRLEQDPPRWSRVAFSVLDEAVGRRPPHDHFSHYGSVGLWSWSIACVTGLLTWALEVRGRRRVLAVFGVMLMTLLGAYCPTRWLGIRLTMRRRRQEVAEATASLELEDVHDGEGFGPSPDVEPAASASAIVTVPPPGLIPTPDRALEELRRQNEALADEVRAIRGCAPTRLPAVAPVGARPPDGGAEPTQPSDLQGFAKFVGPVRCRPATQASSRLWGRPPPCAR